MDFFNALKEIVQDKKITRVEWGDKKYFGELKDGILQLHKPDGKYYPWIISEGDMMGTDWIIL